MISLLLVMKRARQNNLGAKAPSGRMAERSKALASFLEFDSHAGSNPAPSTMLNKRELPSVEEQPSH